MGESGGALPGPSDGVGPGHYGFSGWVGDPALFTGATHAPIGGRLWLSQVFLTGTRVSNVVLNINAAGAGTTAGANFVGVYSSAGTLVAKSADLSASFLGTGNLVVPVPSWSPPAGTIWCWTAILANATTLPQFIGFNAATAYVNLGLAVANLRTAISVATGLSALPAVLNPASDISDPGGVGNIWCALS